MYGAQTWIHPTRTQSRFENDVEMYGAQTSPSLYLPKFVFENDVEMYGAQTYFLFKNIL